MIATQALHSSTVGCSSSFEEVTAAGVALCKRANEAGIFLQEEPGRDKIVLKQIKREAKDWLRSVRRQIDGMTVGEALTLLTTYDAVYRMAYGTAADTTFINRYTMAAFESRIRGNKEVDPYILYRQINAGIARRDPLYLGRPLQWSTTILDRWYKEFARYSTIRPQTSDSRANSLYDRLQKAAILLETDLWAYEGTNQKAFKQRLLSQFSPLLYQTEHLCSHDLKAYNRFLLSSRRQLSK